MIYNKIFSYFNDRLLFYTNYNNYKKIKKKFIDSEVYLHKNNPLISVYIPTYNRRKLLESRSLPSVLGQSYQNIELIVIGDRCNDDTQNYIESINDKRVKFININYKKKPFPETKENLWLAGEVIAANYALTICNGEWIARLDDDDIFTKTHIEDLLKYANLSNLEFVSGMSQSEIEGKEILHDSPFLHSNYFKNKHQKINNTNSQLGAHSTWMYKNYLKIFKYNTNCWRKSWNRVNDVDLAQRFFKAGVKMGYLKKSTLIQNPRPGSNNIGFKAL